MTQPILINEIFADEDFNCRGMIDPIDVIDLAKNIKEHGLLQPILVQPWTEQPGKKYRLVAGYRRFAAMQINKADYVEAIIVTGLSDLAARGINLSENIQRRDLTILQEARAIDHFRRAEWTETEVAQELKVSKGWVQTRFMLLELPEAIQKDTVDSMLTQPDIRKLYSIRNEGEEAQMALLHKIKDNKILGKKREVKVSAVIKPSVRRPRSIAEIEELQDVLIKVFDHNIGTKVLGWAAGHVSDEEMDEYIADLAKVEEKIYIRKSFARELVEV